MSWASWASIAWHAGGSRCSGRRGGPLSSGTGPCGTKTGPDGRRGVRNTGESGRQHRDDDEGHDCCQDDGGDGGEEAASLARPARRPWPARYRSREPRGRAGEKTWRTSAAARRWANRGLTWARTGSSWAPKKEVPSWPRGACEAAGPGDGGDASGGAAGGGDDGGDDGDAGPCCLDESWGCCEFSNGV